MLGDTWVSDRDWTWGHSIILVKISFNTVYWFPGTLKELQPILKLNPWKTKDKNALPFFKAAPLAFA